MANTSSPWLLEERSHWKRRWETLSYQRLMASESSSARFMTSPISLDLSEDLLFWRGSIKYVLKEYFFILKNCKDKGKQHHTFRPKETQKTNGVILSLLSFTSKHLFRSFPGCQQNWDSLAYFFYSAWCLVLLLDVAGTISASEAAALFLPPFPPGVRGGLK